MLHIHYVESCLPDYWSGHHLPHICVPVGPDTTFEELKQGLKNEVMEGAIMGGYDCPIDTEEWADDALAAIDLLKSFKEKPFWDLEDYESSAYFIFSTETL